MAILKRALFFAGLALITLFICLQLFGYTYLLEGARVTYLQGKKSVGIYDFRIQETRVVASASEISWERHPYYNKHPLSEEIRARHQRLETLAFIVMSDGKILAEHYFNGGGPSHLSGLWSITKTYASVLLHKAVEDGLIDSIDDPVSKYLPEWQVKQNRTLTLRHLASMSAGLYWDEFDQRPLALIAKMNFTDDITHLSLNDLYAIGEPGEVQHYNSGATQLIGTILSRLLKSETISDYAARKLWQPLGAAEDAFFILDHHDGMEKTFGGLVATPLDIARLGQVINNNGRWHDKTIINPELMALIKTLPYNNKTYTYGYWRGEFEGEPFYYQAGHGGQLVLSMPSRNLVITRLGHRATPKQDVEETAPDAKAYIREALRLVAASKNAAGDATAGVGITDKHSSAD
jgi:CubicO group peptidase (beta-lactamase class C family)